MSYNKLITSRVKKGLILVLALPILAFFGESFIGLAKLAVSERIKSKTQLAQIFNEEKQKLGLDNIDIYAKFDHAPLGIGYCRQKVDYSYEIGLDNCLHLGDNRANLRHELYHVYDSVIGRDAGSPWGEFKAMLYQNHNIKL